MPYLHQFGPDDIFFNRMVTTPQFDFVMFSGSAYINNNADVLGHNLMTGTVNLYEYNVDRNGVTQALIQPFVSRDTESELTFQSNPLSRDQFGSLDDSIENITSL